MKGGRKWQVKFFFIFPRTREDPRVQNMCSIKWQKKKAYKEELRSNGKAGHYFEWEQLELLNEAN